VDDLWATKSEDARAISFQDFQPMWSWLMIHQRQRQTDGQTDRQMEWQMTCDRKTALCTVVHRAVKTNTELK